MATIVEPPMGYRDDILRAEKGRLAWTEHDLAERSGLSIPTVRAILRGETKVLFINVEKVTHALSLTMQQVCEPKPTTQTIGTS